MKFSYQETSLVSQSNLNNIQGKLIQYQKHLQDVVRSKNFLTPEASLVLPCQPDFNHIIKRVKKENHLKYVVVIGIGGSNLGTQAIYEALNKQNPGKYKTKLLFLDTVSSLNLISVSKKLLEKGISKQNFLIVVISKSGTTTETIANAESLFELLKPRHKNVYDRTVVITDIGSKLWENGIKQKMDILEIPKYVGGRYSVFSPVGLFPLALVGIDIKSLIRGAKKSLDEISSKNNFAFDSAITTFYHSSHAKQIRNTFFFAPELESLGKWERQLVAESLGKKQKGILPIVSIGSTDLHSVAQLYFGGKKNIFTNIVSVENSPNVSIPKKLIFKNLINHLEGSSTNKLMNAIVKGVKSAYKKSKLPFVEIEFSRVNEFELGFYMQSRMIETMLLANLMKINAFDQPNVEMYKGATREILKHQHGK